MRLGLFSVSYAGFWGQARLDVPGFIAKAAELGFDSVLLAAKRPHLSVLDADDACVRSTREALRANGLGLIGLACYNDILLKAPEGVPIVEMQMAYIESAARITAELGGELVRIFTGYCNAGDSYASEYKKVMDFLGEAAERAGRHGITLAVQNHHDMAVGSELLEALLAELDLPNLKAGYDAWSPYLRGEDLRSWARTMASRTAMTIAANYRRYPRYSYIPELVNYRKDEPDFVRATCMSDGEIDYAAFFAGLTEGGFDGPAVYEMCSPLIGGPSMENLDAKARDFLAFMKAV